MLHSRFTQQDRSKKEVEILQTGKTATNAHEIWIATSVVEASLDIDFDYLFTELLDLFSLFQRFGRVNRKGVKSIAETNCFVYTQLQDSDYMNPEEKDLLVRFQSAMNDQSIDPVIYHYSKKAIETVSGILSEQEKNNLIEHYLSYENLIDSRYDAKYCRMYEYLNALLLNEKDKDTIRDIRNIDIIPYSIYEAHMVLCQDLVQVKMRNFSHFNPPEAQPQCVFFHTIVRIHLVTYSCNGYEFVSYCRKLPDIQKSTGMPAYNRGF